MSDSVKVTDITVNKYRLIVRVQLGNTRYSSCKIKEKLLKNNPTLALHKCKNDSGDKFIDILDKTSLAHVLEHLIIDFQIKYLENSAMSKKSIFGTTEWIDKDKGLARIDLSYADDVIAIKAINSAEELLNKCFDS